MDKHSKYKKNKKDKYSKDIITSTNYSYAPFMKHKYMLHWDGEKATFKNCKINCYGLNYVTSYMEVLTPNVSVFRDRAFRR